MILAPRASDSAIAESMVSPYVTYDYLKDGRIKIKYELLYDLRNLQTSKLVLTRLVSQLHAKIF